MALKLDMEERMICDVVGVPRSSYEEIRFCYRVCNSGDGLHP